MQQFGVVGFRLDCEHNLVTLLPLCHEAPDQLRRILKVGGHRDDSIALRLQQGVITRSDGAEVAGIKNYLESRLIRGKTSQNVLRAIRGSIIDYDNLISVI